MEKFNILRCEKLKSVRAVLGAIAHNTRKVTPPNADATKARLNRFPKSMSSYAKCKQRFDNKIEQVKAIGNIRKNAVYAHEFIVSCSPELMSKMNAKQQQQYFNDAAKFIIKLHGGDASNLISMSIHNDESNCHAHYLILPILEERLNSRAILGGHKSRLSTLQTTFTREVGSKYGMKRGRKGAKTSHKKVSQYYREVENKKALEREIEQLEEKAQTLRNLIGQYQTKLQNIKTKYLNEFKEFILKPAEDAVYYLFKSDVEMMQRKLSELMKNARQFVVEKELPKDALEPIIEPARPFYKR